MVAMALAATGQGEAASVTASGTEAMPTGAAESNGKELLVKRGDDRDDDDAGSVANSDMD